MDSNLINNPENFCLNIRGTFKRKELPPLIFQRSFGKLQKKIGPIIPFNPRSRKQQLNRIRFLAAIQASALLDNEQRQLYVNRTAKHKYNHTWRAVYVSNCLKANHLNRQHFNEPLFYGGLPRRDVFRFNEITFDDVFMTAPESLPTNRVAIEAKYPNIDISSIFPEVL